MFKGIPVSPGVVVGIAYRVEPMFAAAEPQHLQGEGPELVAEEAAKFDRAVADSVRELNSIVQKVAERVGRNEAEIFEGHLRLVQDETLSRKVRDLIATQRMTAISALQIVLNEYASRFARIEADYFRERLADIRDVITRIGGHLQGETRVLPKTDHDVPIILVAHEILPSQALSLGELAIGGIVTEIGGGTSHAAILSRSRGIPAICGVVGVTHDVQTGDAIIVDGREGTVMVRPDSETAAAYRKLQREFFQMKDRLVLNRDKPAITADGALIDLLANINGTADADAAISVGAGGVGLFRTEYLFLAHQDVPDEEEQYRHYREVIERAPNRIVTIRTLDLGGDKTVAYLGQRNEANPFMGWRSMRLASEHPRLFEVQIRAILRAAQHGEVSMMFPMITNLEELRQVNAMVERVKRDLDDDGVPYGQHVKTGVMIEVPAAAVCIDALLRETDFISIGSNDLIQYLVAADRDNAKVAHLCEPLSPAIFKVLQMVLQACQKIGTPVTVCGEMAGQPRSVLVLYGLGLRRFSMSPAFIPTIKSLLSDVTTAQAERYAHQVLQLKTSEEIRAYLTARLTEVSSDLTMFDFS